MINCKAQMTQVHKTGMVRPKFAILTGMWLLLFCQGVVIEAREQQKAASREVLSRCIKASGGITADMRACLHAEYARLDRELNIVYKAVMKQLRTEYLRNRLLESQRVWIWRRDYDCKLTSDRSSTKGGTANDLIYDDCLVEMVRARIDWLKKVPDNPGYLKKV